MRVSILVCASVLAASPASSAVLYLTSGKSVFLNGQVSDYVGQKGIGEERFATGKLGGCVQTRPSTVVFSSLGTPMGPLPNNAGLVRGAFAGQALPPGSTSASIRDGIPIADQSCYLAAPLPNSGGPGGQIVADIALSSSLPILYFGFYWGSIDPANTLTLLSRPNGAGARTPITIAGLSDANGVFTGNQLLAMFNHPIAFNSYVSFQFTAAENFGTVVFGAPTPGFEVDNIAYATTDFLATPPAQNQHTQVAVAPAFARRFAALGFTAVPEPALAGLLGLAALPFALRLRRRSA